MKRSLLDIQLDETSASTIVSVAGILDISTVDELDGRVRPLLRTGTDVIIDLSDVTMCDSTGLGAIVKFDRFARGVECSFSVRRPRPHVAEVFAMTGIDQVIRVHADDVPLSRLD
jgi:anti-anti-sigma factor